MRSVLAGSGSLTQLAICVPIGLLAAVVFIVIYAPARRAAVNLLDTLSVLRKAACPSASDA
jgi:hypothetical protein